MNVTSVSIKQQIFSIQTSVTFSMILESVDGKQEEAHKSYPCMGCKNVYEDKFCVVKQTAQNKAFFLCLNCDGWILRKNEILLPGWNLFDENGHLKQNV